MGRFRTHGPTRNTPTPPHNPVFTRTRAASRPSASPTVVLQQYLFSNTALVAAAAVSGVLRGCGSWPRCLADPDPGTLHKQPVTATATPCTQIHAQHGALEAKHQRADHWVGGAAISHCSSDAGHNLRRGQARDDVVDSLRLSQHITAVFLFVRHTLLNKWCTWVQVMGAPSGETRRRREGDAKVEQKVRAAATGSRCSLRMPYTSHFQIDAGVACTSQTR